VKGSNALILLLDDDASSREMVRAVLLNERYRTLAAGNGEEALDLIRNARHRWGRGVYWQNATP